MGKVIKQLRFRPALPSVQGNVDYERERDLLIRIDELLIASGIEEKFVQQSMAQWKQSTEARAQNAKYQRRKEELCTVALRAMILMEVIGESYRVTSQRIAQCPLFQWFCQLDYLGVVKVPSKSTLQRFHVWVDTGTLRRLNIELVTAAARTSENQEAQALDLKNAIELETIWLDSTAVKANIHYPVDWVLLRDATRTLMLATQLIREHGLRHRMKDPKGFLKQMNGLCMAMTGTRRKPQVKRSRKRVLRQMKRLTKTVRDHALRHRDLLDREWEKTDWTRPQAEQVLGRIDNVLVQLPGAIEQAHRRIIQEKAVNNEKKILSLYEAEIGVIVRGKANAEVEFGNSLMISEQADGIIVNWKLTKDGAPSDSQELKPRIAKIQEDYGESTVKAVVTDRQFDSAENRAWLKEQNIYNGLCPRGPKELKAKTGAKKFQKLQKRRAQTEARISILKNGFLGDPMSVKGFKNREQRVGWGVLAHNLWVIARLEKVKEHEEDLAKAA